MFLLAPLALADEKDVAVIVNNANVASYYAGEDGKAEVSMTITDELGRERKRQFTILRKNIEDGGEQYFYVYFKKPSDIRKMVFMVHKHPGKDDERWLYLPALDLVKRIAAADKRTSFVGSNYLYEDVSGRDPSEDIHELMETTDQYYIIRNVPKDTDKVAFSSYTVWIDKNSFIPMKTEYKNKNNKIYRIVEALEVQQFEGLPTVTVSKATNMAAGSCTLIELQSIRYNIGIEDDLFTERSLRRPPREVR